jgi:chromatin remodeling complex protein RSC6
MPDVDTIIKPMSSVDKMIVKIDALETALVSLKKAAEIAVAEIKQLKKQSLKLSSKQQKTNKIKTNHKPHGFAIPSKVSYELCVFMGKEPGTLIARTEVTKKLTEYITLNGLQNPENKRQIIPDEHLMQLLGEDAKDVFLTHFTMQKYMNRHFEKAGTGTITV